MAADPSQPTSRAPRGAPPSRPDAVALVWLGGIALAVVAYVVGPSHFLASVLAAISHVGVVLDDLVRNLTATAFDVMRAAAIGLYGTFAALSIIAIGRGERGRLGLVVITIVFLMLVWDAWGEVPASTTRWLAALVLAGVAAMTMTRRLIYPSRRG